VPGLPESCVPLLLRPMRSGSKLTTNGLPGFNENLLRSKRWLINARPKCVQAPQWEGLLLMTPDAQLLFVRRVVGAFTAKASKVKASMRSRLRPSTEEWDKTADCAALVSKVCEAVKANTTLADDRIDLIHKSFISGCPLEQACGCHAASHPSCKAASSCP